MSFLLFEWVYRAVHRALLQRQETARLGTPAVFAGQTEEFVFNHSMAGRLAQIFQTPECAALLAWLRRDEVVARYAQTQPGVSSLLDQWVLALRGLQEVRP